MLNKPKYSLFSNTLYALKGFKDLIKNESSFRLEVIIILFLLPIIFIVDKDLVEKLFLLGSVFLLLIVEAINGAIERVVDLVTKEYHPLAGKAKDAGSSAVFISIVFAVIVWSSVFLKG